MDVHRIQKKTKVVNRISIEYIMRINGMYPSIMGYELVVVALIIYTVELILVYIYIYICNRSILCRVVSIQLGFYVISWGYVAYMV